MPSRNSDRNLLFGILALQMDMISRESLIKAMNDWVLDKEKPLGEIFLSNKALSSRNRDLLEQMVDAHVEAHEGEPEKSLAAMGSVDSIRHDLEQINATEIAESLIHLPAATPGENTDATVSFVASSTEIDAQSSLNTRFHIVRPHAEGGLGKVSVALDRELNREVALKEIKPGFAHDESARARFVLEAEITGGLEHPGIVPVYSLGHRDNGQPFYAMRFIKGDSLKEACAKYHEDNNQRSSSHRAIKSRKLLGRFIDVCNAIEYAHSRGVLHRDLKPDNVMLGKYGETLVVDWGLAKAIGRGADYKNIDEQTMQPGSSDSSPPTQMGSAVGTPNFMSPEQAAGQLDKLGPTSDVYGLGATLYFLLVNRSPFGGNSTDTILGKVQRGDFDAPRAVDPTLPKPLDAICRKAMALEPSDRYASPRELTGDIERWLADEPVTCYHEPPLERSWRWLRHHRHLVQTTFAVLLASLIGLTIILSLRELHSRQLDEANDLLSQRNARLRETIDAYVDTVQHDELLREERFQPLRKRLLENALTHYQNLVRETEQRGDQLDDLADAVDRVAWISSSTGDLNTAVDSYDEVIRLRKRIVGSNPHEADHHHELAGSYNNLGLLYAKVGKSQESIASFEDAIKHSRLAVELEPEEPDHQLFLANHYLNMVLAYPRAADREKAEGFLEESLAIYRRLADDDPTDPEYQNGVAGIYISMGTLSERAGQMDSAIESFQNAIDVSEQLLDSHPGETAYQRTLLASCNCLGSSYRRAGRFEESWQLHQRALSVSERLLDKNPNFAEVRHDLVKSLVGLGNVMSTGSEFGTTEGIEILQRAVVTAEGLVDEHPRSKDYRIHLAIACGNLANLYLENNQAQLAIDHYLKARENHLLVLSTDPNDPRANPALISTLINLGRSYGDLGEDAKEQQSLDEAVQRGEATFDHAQALSEFRGLLADAHVNRSNAFLSIGKRAEAMESAESAVELLELVVDDFPQLANYQGQLAHALNRYGQVLMTVGQNDAGIEQFERARQIYLQLLNSDHAAAAHQLGLAESYAGLGHTYGIIGKWDQEEVAYLKAIECWQSLVDGNPSNALYQNGLANLFTNLGNLYQDTGREHEAIKLYEQALAIRSDLVRNNSSNQQFRSGLATTHGALGSLFAALRQYDESLSHLDESASMFEAILVESPTDQSVRRFVQTAKYFKVKTLKQAAWEIATAADADDQAAQVAMQYATQACEITQWQDFECLAALAASHALAGDSEKAVEWQQKSIDLAPADRADELNSHLLLYQGGKRFIRPLE